MFEGKGTTLVAAVANHIVCALHTLFFCLQFSMVGWFSLRWVGACVLVVALLLCVVLLLFAALLMMCCFVVVCCHFVCCLLLVLRVWGGCVGCCLVAFGFEVVVWLFVCFLPWGVLVVVHVSLPEGMCPHHNMTSTGHTMNSDWPHSD